MNLNHRVDEMKMHFWSTENDLQMKKCGEEIWKKKENWWKKTIMNQVVLAFTSNQVTVFSKGRNFLFFSHYTAWVIHL